jgi:hypothetical protein
VILLRDWKVFTLCFGVVNLFDEKYEIRDGRASEFSPAIWTKTKLFLWLFTEVSGVASVARLIG